LSIWNSRISDIALGVLDLHVRWTRPIGDWVCRMRNCWFKLHLMHTNRAPQYLEESIQSITWSSSHPALRSADTDTYMKPCTRTNFGDRGFRSAQN